MLLKNLQLKNFKCFRKTDIDFGKITLLTGANSSGKSSLIDALLAVMQTEKFPLYLSPNGKYKNMGGFENISHRNKNELIEISLMFSKIKLEQIGETYSWKAKSIWQNSFKSAMPNLNYLKSSFNSPASDTEQEIYFKNGKSIFKSFVKYAQEELKSNHKEVSNYEELEFAYLKSLYGSYYGLPGIGNKALIEQINNSFNYIHSYREEPTRQYFQVAKVKNKIEPTGKGYAQQIAEWEETKDSRINLLTEYLQDLKLIHSIKTKKRSDGTFQILVKTKEKSIYVPLTDVGFGVSKILPILVADLQLIENALVYTEKAEIINQSLLAISEPEIDLHPSVQADFAGYLVKQATKNQKQYIIETHSEYLLNRIRLLIAKGEINEADVKVYFFENNGIETKTHSVKFCEDGQITGAPDGFFETYETDIFEIAMKA